MRTNPIRVLLVDDHQMMREGVRRLLNEHPEFCVVGEAATGPAAFDQVQATQPDVVLMDIHLPGKNGIEVSEQLHRDFPAVKVVILSADIDIATVQKALQAGVAGYLAKNAQPDELVRAIRDAADERVYLCQEVAAAVVQDYMKLVVNRSPEPEPVLTERERLLLKLVAEGKRNQEIADAMSVGTKSVETYRSRLMRKRNFSSVAELTRYAIREGIAQP
jgi:DNA-binding NarL/FixJ family response regulator